MNKNNRNSCIIKHDGGTRDFGWVTELSRNLNIALGDNTGRTISMRVGQGLKRTMCSNMSDDGAEKVGHLLMLISAACLNSSSESGRLLGGVIGGSLVVFYQEGK